MRKKNNTNASLLLLSFLILSNLSAYSQRTKHFKYPNTAFGIDIFGGSARVQQSDYATDYDSGINLGVRGLFEYAPAQWFGVSTGLGLDYRRYNELGENNPVHQVLGIQIPVLIQFRLGKVFSVETGSDVNFLVVNNREKEVLNGSPYAFDLIGYGGFRVRLYKGISIGVGIRWGLTPFYEQEKGIPIYYPVMVNGSHRGFTASFRYSFY